MQRCVFAIALLCCAAHAVAQTGPRARTAASVSNGERVYLRVGCYTCHGTVGHGGAARPLAPNVLPLEAFRAWVRTGSANWSFASGMPAFPQTVVTDADLADVRAYLASLPAPPAWQDVPLLNQ